MSLENRHKSSGNRKPAAGSRSWRNKYALSLIEKSMLKASESLRNGNRVFMFLLSSISTKHFNTTVLKWKLECKPVSRKYILSSNRKHRLKSYIIFISIILSSIQSMIYFYRMIELKREMIFWMAKYFCRRLFLLYGIFLQFLQNVFSFRFSLIYPFWKRFLLFCFLNFFMFCSLCPQVEKCLLN